MAEFAFRRSRRRRSVAVVLARAAAHRRASAGRWVAAADSDDAPPPRAPPPRGSADASPAAEEPGVAAEAARRLGVPPERLAAFAEVYGHVGARGAAGWKGLLAKVRSAAEVEAAIDAADARADDDGGGLFDGCPRGDARARARWRARLVWCGRYSAKDATPLAAALATAADQLRAARARRAALLGADGAERFALRVRRARFDDEHLACRARAYPCDIVWPRIGSRADSRGNTLRRRSLSPPAGTRSAASSR